MTTAERWFGSSWELRILLMSISLLALLNITVATGRSKIVGHSLSRHDFTEMSLATRAFLDLGTDAIPRPNGLLRALNDPSQSTGTRQFSSKPTDHQLYPNIESCSLSDIEVTQDRDSYLPDGTPMFHVTIINNCLRCSMDNIHIACGNWASSTVVNPAIFRKLTYNDCIVNNGSPISPMTMVYFEYASTFPYPMHVSTGGACSCS